MTDKRIADNMPGLANRENRGDFLPTIFCQPSSSQLACCPPPEVHRHRAAIRRSEFSSPVKWLLRNGLLDPADSLFDYGCGHGDDLRRLQALGYACDGWDPVHRPASPRRPADIVNLGFVVNVIEAPEERAQTLRDAWSLCRKLRVVAARIAAGQWQTASGEYEDGVLTRLGTFQKRYTQSEQRIDDLSVYLALSRFRKRTPIGSLPLDLQRDIREFFGTYKRACESADAMLFQAGNPARIDEACEKAPVAG
jgi:hypothetical protein